MLGVFTLAAPLRIPILRRRQRGGRGGRAANGVGRGLSAI
jgi:hypothetical protein